MYIAYKHSISYFQPLVLLSALVAYKDSSKVSNKTLQRLNFVKKELFICSGNHGTEKQAAHLIQSFGRDERENLLKLANILPFEVDAETRVAMKVDLGIPWEKLKHISR